MVSSWVCLFYCNYAVQNLKPKKAKKILDDAVDQIVKTDLRTYDEKTQLWKHAWDETHSRSGQTRKTERASIPGQEPSDGTSWR